MKSIEIKGEQLISLVIKERLKSLRKQYKWTQEDVAKQLGIPRSTYSGYEKVQREAGYEILLKMADIFHVSIDYLLGKSNQPNLALEKDFSLILNRKGLHWKGVTLRDREVKLISELIETIIEARTKEVK